MPIYKNAYLVKRNPSLTPEAFPARWHQHAKLAAKTRITNYFTGVVQCSLLRDADFPKDATQEYDGACLLYLRDRAAVTDMLSEPELEAVLIPDELKAFSRKVLECIVTTEERVVREGPFTGILLLRFVQRAPRLTAAAFHEEWAKDHRAVELAGQTGALIRRAVENVVIVPPPPDFPFDLIEEIWFDDLEAARRFDSDRPFQEELAATRARLCNPAGCVTLLAKVTHAYKAGAGG